MVSMQHTLAAQYRARAQAAREQAAVAPDRETQKRLLNDAELWERMAKYEETEQARTTSGNSTPPRERAT